MNLNPATTLKIYAIGVVPLMVTVVWLLPKFLTSKRPIKIMIGAIIVSICTLLITNIVDSSSLDIQNIKFVTAITALVWGVAGFFVGVYFDVRLRVELGTKYYQEFPRLRMYGVEYGVIGAFISLPLGIATGWLVAVFGASFLGLMLTIAIGAIFGGFLAEVLNRHLP